MFFFFKQKTAYEIKECDWSSDVCSSDLSSLKPAELRLRAAEALLKGWWWLCAAETSATHISSASPEFFRVINWPTSASLTLSFFSSSRPLDHMPALSSWR